jgi:hypothetical protein
LDGERRRRRKEEEEEEEEDEEEKGGGDSYAGCGSSRGDRRVAQARSAAVFFETLKM